MATKDPLVYIMHIRDCCQRVAEYAATGGPDWPKKPLIMDAICRNITIIGEAARKLDDQFRARYPEIPWAGIIGARNVVMHAYEYLNPDLVQEMAEEEIPVLLTHCLRILAER